MNGATRNALVAALGSVARVNTAVEILGAVQSRAPCAWIKHRYIDHLSALTQAGLIEYEPGVISRHGNVTYRVRLVSLNKPDGEPVYCDGKGGAA